MKLSDSKCNSAKAQDKRYKLTDGDGLYLQVHPNGNKFWRFRYTFNKKETTISLGRYPELSLSEARAARQEARGLVYKGVDPKEHKKDIERQRIREANNSFEVVARDWHDKQSSSWSEGHSKKVLGRLEKNLFPLIGHRPISKIEPPELLEALKTIEHRGAYDLANRLKQISGQIFRYGIQSGKAQRDAAADLKGALKNRKSKHHEALDISEVPDFISAVEQNNPRLFQSTRIAIKFSLLTFQRPGEIRKARWDEIDLDKKQWTIPASKMKSDRSHVVPLSLQALNLLEEQKNISSYLGSDYIFPPHSNNAKHPYMSDATVNNAIKALGYGDKQKAHGFRALARTAIREELEYDSEVIEKQLAHKTKNPLGEAYDRTQFLKKRRAMMQDWADYIDRICKEHDKKQ